MSSIAITNWHLLYHMLIVFIVLHAYYGNISSLDYMKSIIHLTCTKQLTVFCNLTCVLFLDAHAHLYFASNTSFTFFFGQLLLIGGHVDEPLNTLEKQCCNSASVLPIRYIYIYIYPIYAWVRFYILLNAFFLCLVNLLMYALAE